MSQLPEFEDIKREQTTITSETRFEVSLKIEQKHFNVRTERQRFVAFDDCS
jgi:hypothetical protein